MKTISTLQIACSIAMLVTVLAGCKKATDENGASSELKASLISPTGKVWQLQDADASTVWEDQIGAGWVQYTNQPGHVTLSDCVKNNNYIVFNTDQTYTQSIYTCNLFETNFPLFSQTGGPGKWTLAADRTLTLENYATYRLLSANANDLYIADLYGTYHFVSVNSRPFLTSTQYLGGTGNKTWQISKIKIGGVEQKLTAAQAANRLTFNITGSLVNYYTNTTYGQPATGSWTFDAARHKFVYNLAASQQTPAINNQAWTVLELTETTFTYYYFDDKNNYFTVYWVPAS